MKTQFDINIDSRKIYLIKKGKETSQFVSMVRKLYDEDSGTIDKGESLEENLRFYFSRLGKGKYQWRRAIFKRMLLHLYYERCFMILNNLSYVQVLFRMALFGDKMVRPVEDWKRDGLSAEKQLNELIKHCFELYKTPPFLMRTFYYNNHAHMKWYVELARGRSLFSLPNFPTGFTKKMAHAFLNLKGTYPVEHAMKRAKVFANDPKPWIGDMIVNSRLVDDNRLDDPFWGSVVQFFCKEERLNHQEFYGILDYIENAKRENQDFSIKGRSYNGLMRLSEAWHERVYLENQKKNLKKWKASGIEPFTQDKVNDKEVASYRIEELCNSIELFKEGRKMGHCVASYSENCARGNSAIFSLRTYNEEEELMGRSVTIEVNPKQLKIVQARARFNETPSKEDLKIIKSWMKEVGLTMSKYAY